MRSLLGLLSILLLSASIIACGGTGEATDSQSTARTGANTIKPLPNVRDLSDDDDGDNDNQYVRSLGPEAPPAVRSAVTAVVKHYYLAAYQHDGTTACSLMYPPLAKAIAKEYGHAANLPALHGSTCATVMSKLFIQEHRRLTTDLAMAVSTVRVLHPEKEVLAMLYINKYSPERFLGVLKVHGAWTIEALLDSKLP